MNKLIIALLLSAVSMSASAGGDKMRGEALLKKETMACASCNGKDYKTPMVGTPILAGQHADYLYHALVTYKRGDKGYGRNNGIMAPQVQNLSDQDMADIAAYLASLPSGLVSKR